MTDVALSRQRMNFWGAALTLSLATLLTRTATFVTQTVIAHQFGTSADADAYFAAEHILLLLGDFIVIGFGIAFIPLWMEYQVRCGAREAHAFANAFISLVTGATVVVAIVIALAAPVLIRLVAPGFSGQAAKVAAQLLATMALAVVFLGLTAGCTGLLEAHRHFVWPEISRTAYRVVILLAAIALSGRLGVMALAWGSVVGSLVRLMVQWPHALKLRVMHFTLCVDHEGVRRAGKRMLPIFVAHAGMRVTMLLGNAVASGLPEGAVSGLAYAGRVMLLPVALLALPLRTTIFPTLAHHVAKEQLEVMSGAAIKSLRMLSFVTVPVCAGLILLRVPVIRLLFQRGAFDSAATQMTASVLGWYAVGLPAIGGMLIVNSIYFSLGDPITLVKLNLINWVTGLGLSVVLVEPLAANGIALGLSLSTVMTYGLAILTLRRRLPAFQIRSLGQVVVKALLAGSVMVGLLLGLWALVSKVFYVLDMSPMAYSLIALLGGLAVGASTYGLAAVALRMEEALALVRVVAQWSRLGRRSDR